MLESIPYCFNLSVIEIANPFLITNTLETNTIAIINAPRPYINFKVSSLKFAPSYANNSEFIFISYL